MKRARTLALLALTLFSALAYALPVKEGEMAPGFTVRTVAGKKLDLGAFRGKVILLDFWAPT